MIFRSRSLLFSAFTVLLTLLIGCEQLKLNDPTAPDAGFTKTRLGGGGSFAIKNDDALAGYHGIFIRSVTARTVSELDERRADSSELAALEYAYESSLRSVVGSAIPVVSTPAPMVMLIEASIDNVAVVGVGDPERAWAVDEINEAALGGGAGLDPAGYPLIDASSLGMGALSIRLQVRDAMTGDLLATFQDDDFGGGIESIGGRTSWSRVTDAFNRWNHELKATLVEKTGI